MRIPTPKTISPSMLLWLFLSPSTAFEVLSNTRPKADTVFFRLVIWLAAIPPAMAYLGGSWFGWRLGAQEPLYLPNDVLIKVSISYFIGLLFGFVSSAATSRISSKQLLSVAMASCRRSMIVWMTHRSEC